MLKGNKGQSLLEMVVIIGVTGMALVAITLAATLSVRNARVSRERAEARNLAFEVLENVRDERNTDPETFFTAGTRVVDLAPVGTTPVYQRQVTYTEAVAGQLYQIRVNISWEDGGDTFNVVEETTIERYFGS